MVSGILREETEAFLAHSVLGGLSLYGIIGISLKYFQC